MKNPNTEQFLKEVTEICKKYNISISHEDYQGGFELENYREDFIKWFNDARDNTNLVKAPSIGKNIKIIEKFKNFLYTFIATIAALYVYYLISGEVICFKHL
jgi:hypothetical protein